MATKYVKDIEKIADKFLLDLQITELETAAMNLKSSGDVSFITIPSRMDVRDSLNHVRSADSKLYELLLQNLDYVSHARVGNNPICIIFGKNMNALNDVLVVEPIAILEKDVVAKSSHQKNQHQPTKHLLQLLAVESAKFIVLAIDADCLLLWKVSKNYTSPKSTIALGRLSVDQKKRAFRAAVKDHSRYKFFCMVDPGAQWAVQILDELSIINNRQFNSDALVNPLESIVKENRAFEGTRLFAEAELLPVYFKALDDGTGNATRGCAGTSAALKSKCIKWLFVSESADLILFQLRLGGEDTFLVRRGDEHPVLPEQYRAHGVVLKLPLLIWLKQNVKELKIRILMTSKNTEAGVRLDENCDGIGAILVAPCFIGTE